MAPLGSHSCNDVTVHTILVVRLDMLQVSLAAESDAARCVPIGRGIHNNSAEHE